LPAVYGHSLSEKCDFDAETKKTPLPMPEVTSIIGKQESEATDQSRH
jgi:hypothetical protein